VVVEVRDLRQRFVTSVFPKLAAQRYFFIPDIIATSFLPELLQRFAI
jgi:hypothetical protein